MVKSETTSGPIRVGIVGAGGFARQTIAVLPDCPDVRVVAVADINRETAEAAANGFGAKVYVDVRSMIVESPIDAVIMSLPHDEYPEYVRLAGQRGLHLLKEKPLGRSFDEALSLVNVYDKAERVFMIGTQRRFHPGFVAMKNRMVASQCRPFLVRSHFLFNWSGDFGWRGQKGKAGFGAFGDAGYHNIDLLTWLVGPPQEVYAMHSSGGRVNPAHPYDTDDTGLCMLHYAGGMMGYVACSWVTQPSVLDVIVHSPAGTMIATPEKFQMFDLAGKVIETLEADQAQSARDTMRAKIDAFVAAIRAGEKSYPCSARENMVNQAVVEAAYLSSRMGQPQLPARIFELNQRSIDDYTPRPAGDGKAARGGPARR